jgi:hypothetical protein
MSENTADLTRIFDEISKEMRSNFNKIRVALKNSGSKGESIEEIVRKFLQEYLPKNLAISSGMIVDSNGNSSKQIDIIIYDALKTPIFFKSGHIQVLPVECVYSVIEVKSMLNKDELEKIFANMDSVRNLEKKAYYPEGDLSHPVLLYGKEWNIWPINYLFLPLILSN